MKKNNAGRSSKAETKVKSSLNKKEVVPGLDQVLNSFLKFKTIKKIEQIKKCDGVVYIFGSESGKNKTKNIQTIVDQHALDYQKNDILKSDKNFIHFVGLNGPVWIVIEDKNNSYGFIRDQLGGLAQSFIQHKLKNVFVFCQSLAVTHQKAAVVGLELACYNFLNFIKNQKSNFENFEIFTNIQDTVVTQAQTEARSIQLARHLVNLPPNMINPANVEKLVLSLPLSKNSRIEIWNEDRCEKENMNLLLAVGSGSPSSPRMIRIKYRPTKSKNKKPVAFVGKGITFDTGGLDIKPSSGMRLMKKDMGGAAAVLALALWVDQANYQRPCDFYLALAENSVDGFSMRPSDIYKSRAGYVVEIDNTDAEGRLVLADVMDVAAKQTGADDPEYLVDVATLTGAIKVALGSDVAGLFCNDDKMAKQIFEAGEATSEQNWRMPLVQRYFSSLNSSFADFKNSGEGFGGAITAALFLEKFTNGKKWAHLDVYCWTDKSTGALAAGQGSGQPVQSLVQWLKSIV